MSSTVDNVSTGPAPAPEAARRSRDSEATRAALLRAAGSAFDELGYELATTREIGERAGVDPALIARYFGSKEGLFLAAIAAEEAEYEFDAETLVRFLLERWDAHGHNPLSRALATLGLSDEMRDRVAGVVRDRLRAQLGAELRRRGVPDCEMRAELLVAIAVGVSMTRANGTLEALAAAERESVLTALEPAIAALVSLPSERGDQT